MKQRKLTATNFFLLGIHQRACCLDQNPPKSMLNQLKLTLFRHILLWQFIISTSNKNSSYYELFVRESAPYIK